MRLSSLTTFLLAAALSSTAFAQSNSGTLSGVVVDGLGAALPRATVSLHNAGNTIERHTTADASGHYTITNLPAEHYEVDAGAAGFSVTQRRDVILAAGQSLDLNLTLQIADITQLVTVEAEASNSIAAQYAVLDARLDAHSARTEISDHFIQEFTAPTSDYAEITQMAPGAFSVNSNGVGLGDAKVAFRGFADGNYDITFDGIPFEDTNSPTHHSWAFFPGPLIGGVDFDRSPGSASTVGPTPFGGSINLLSRNLSDSFNVRGGVSYGSFNTILTNVELDSGKLGRNGKTRLVADFNKLTSDGFQTFNAQQHYAGGTKVQYAFNDEKVLTGFAGVVLLDTNTPNSKGPTRAQYQAQYNYLLQNTDPSRADYVGYNFYHIPTDFEYVGYRTPIARGFHFDTKGYTYSYYNQQNYALPISASNPSISCTPVNGITPCGVDKLNSYRRYGDISTVSQVSKFGIFRGGLWYEWATTSRHQVPQNVVTGVDDSLPNFNQRFITTTYQPFVEYEFHPTSKLAVTGGFKYARYGFDLTQYADNGSVIGNTSALGLPAVYHQVSYNAYMPSFDVNYRVREAWSVYAQFATGSIIPPSSVFDVANVSGAVNGVCTPPACTLIANPVSIAPKPSYAKSFQAGTVVKLRRVTLSADAYYISYGNSYTASPDPNAVGASEFQSSGTSHTKGFEADTNISLGRGFFVYMNGTVGADRYVSQYIDQGTRSYANPNFGAWVANTPANTEAWGLTYQRKAYDFGFFAKRVGPEWNDNKASVQLTYSDGTTSPAAKPVSITANQVIPIDPFSNVNAFLNYTIRGNSRFDNTKVKFSMNNILDAHNITGVTAATKGTTFVPNALDTLGLLPGRSFTISVVFGYGRER